MTRADSNSITGLYVTYYGRPADQSGLNYWIGQGQSGVSLESIATSFGGAQESLTKYPYLATPNVSDPTAFVTSIYVNAFNRQPDAAGLTFWVNRLKTQGASQAPTFILTVLLNAQGTDFTALQNKANVATRFTTGLINNNITPTTQIFADGTGILSTITSDTATVTAGNTAVDQKLTGYTSAGTAGTSIPLTVSVVDNLVGTANNDTFIGANTGTAATDLVQASDKIDGGAGVDTFQYTGAYGTAAVPTLLNVENVELLSPTAAGTIDFTGKATGLQKVTIKGTSPATFTAKGLSGITLGVEGSALSAGATPSATATISTSLVADFGSTTTSANFSIKDAVVATLDLTAGAINAALATLNIDANGLGKNLIGLTLPAATKTLKITGAGTIDLGTTPTTVSTIDASANTGGVKVAVGTVNATFTGGSGNDTFSSTLGTFDANDQLDGGAGTTDTLLLTGLAAGAAPSATQYAAINAVKNFEVLNLSGAGITVDASQITAFQNYILTTTGVALLVTGATVNNTFTVAGTGSSPAGATVTSFGLTGTGAANIALQDTAVISALNLTGVTSLNIESKKKDATTASNSITLNTGTAVPIKVKGDSALTITQTTTTNLNIDATGFKGALTATSSATSGSSTLIGGDVNDALTGGALGSTTRLVGGLGRDALTGGAGVDTFVFSIAGSNAGSFTGGTTDTYDTVSSFTTGTDKIELSGSVFTVASLTSQSSVQAAVGSASTLSAALGSAATAIGASKFGAFTFAGDTYILGNDATVGTLNQSDLLIKIAGFTTTLPTTDFAFS